MTRWLPLVFLLLAAAPAGPSLAQRKRFAEQHPLKLVIDWQNEPCVRVMAPAALGCSRPAWVCPRSFGSAMCTGEFYETRGVNFSLSEPTEAEADAEPLPTLELEAESGQDWPEGECARDVGFTISSGLSKEQVERERREFAKEQHREHARCVRQAAARQKAERVTRSCTLLLVDPCRQEAFIRCSGKNGESGEAPLGKTLQFSFAPQADGGVPLGGEWELPEEE